MLNDIVGEHNHFPCNATGEMEVWTTNPDLKARTQWECINYVPQDDLREWGCNSLFEFLVSEDGEYFTLGTTWQPHCLSVTWSDGDQKEVEAAICDHLDSESLSAQQGPLRLRFADPRAIAAGFSSDPAAPGMEKD